MSTKADESINPHTSGIYETGLTKREYFAAMAMQGLIAARSYDLCDIGYIATDAVVNADALIKELNK